MGSHSYYSLAYCQAITRLCGLCSLCSLCAIEGVNVGDTWFPRANDVVAAAGNDPHNCTRVVPAWRLPSSSTTSTTSQSSSCFCLPFIVFLLTTIISSSHSPGESSTIPLLFPLAYADGLVSTCSSHL